MKRWNKELSTRELMGISQDMMAAYLEVSRVHLAMCESSQRMLPSACSLKMIAIDTIVHIDKREAPNCEIIRQQQKAAAAIELEKYIAGCNYKLLRLRKKIEVLKKQESQCFTTLMVTGRILPDIKEGPKAEHDRTLLGLMETLAIGKLHDCGTSTQTLLQLKIEGLEAQVKRAEELKMAMEG